MGRRGEMAVLEDELARATAGELRVVLLSGEAGVGKSRLGARAARPHPGAAGMFARGHPLGGKRRVRAVDRGARPAAARPCRTSRWPPSCGGRLDDLASLFLRVAVVRGSVPERDPPVPRLLQGLARLLGNLSQDAPLIAVLDDVHFADASSWEALRYFARHLDDARLLVVATSRPAELAGTRSRRRCCSSWTRTGSCMRAEARRRWTGARLGSWPRR